MTHVSTPNAPAALGPYSQAVDTGSTVYCSGQLGLDPATGASTELLNPVPNATSSQALTGDADGAAYYACTDGIYRLAPGGTLPEQVVPAEGTAMSISSNYPLSLLRTAAEDFMVLLFGDSGGNGDLYFYHYDETLPTHADTTLTVWSLADSATARLAVNAYKKANPEVDVTFETAVQTDTDDVSAAINDALTQLNTELLAGEGPDVLLLDRVDYTTYINKGMLADMSDTVPLDALQSNIIDPFMTDGRAYVLPARFIVPALCGDAGTLDGLTDLAAFADKLEAACFETLGAGIMTKDLVGLVDEGTPVTAVTSGEFISAIHDRLAAKL